MTHEKNHHDRQGQQPRAADELHLRETFAAMRERDAARAPAFQRVLRGEVRRGTNTPRRITSRWIPALALGAAAVVAVAMALSTWRGTNATATIATAEAPTVMPSLAFVPGSMRVPTDYFLDLIVASATDEIPSIGEIDWYPLVPADGGSSAEQLDGKAPTAHDSMTHGVPNARRRN
ncbi:MAG: hypothetical protein IT359_12830 [Gemmatimonadaceae bacterium]|nr:hypothetical protein [Gemmatimonadaceae bacterium]